MKAKCFTGPDTAFPRTDVGKAMDRLIAKVKSRRNELPAGLDLLGTDQEGYPLSHLEVGTWSPANLVLGL